jgi:hypothetical protein
MPSIKVRIIRPPPPCASCTVLWSLRGTGQLMFNGSGWEVIVRQYLVYDCRRR